MCFAVLAFAVLALSAGCQNCPMCPDGASSQIVPLPTATPQVADKIYSEVRQSLVAVQYTFASELGSTDYTGQGVVVSDDGLVMTSMSLFPLGIPNAQMQNFKIIIPGDEETEIEALFEGRDERTNVAFIRAKPPVPPATSSATQPAAADAQPRHWKPLTFVENPPQAGDHVYSVGLLPQSVGFHAFIAESTVCAAFRGPVPQILVSAGGLTTTASPVLNTRGQAIGLANAQVTQANLLLADKANPLGALASPPRLFVPSRDFLQSLADTPSAASPLKLPWLGVTQVTGLKKEMLEYYNLKGQTAVQIGEVIADGAAAKAGIKNGDIIVKLNGQSLERGDEPDEAAAIMLRKLGRLKVGAQVSFAIRSSTQRRDSTHNVTVTLMDRPKMAHEAIRAYFDDLGFAVRELVFNDTYARKIPVDSKGVLVSLVKPSSSAQSGHLAGGDLVTQINKTPVADLDHFKKLYTDFRKANPKEAVVLEVLRGVNTEVVRIEPPQ